MIHFIANNKFNLLIINEFISYNSLRVKMGATVQQKQQNLQIPSSLSLDPKIALSDAVIIEQRENAIIFQVPSRIRHGIINSSQKRASSNQFHGQKTGNKSRIGLACTIKKDKSEVQPIIKKYIMKNINVTSQNEYNLRKSLQNLDNEFSNEKISESINHTNFCRLVGFQKKYDGFMCGSHSAVSLVFEHEGDYTLAKQIQVRATEISTKTRRIRDDNGIHQMLQYSFSMTQVLRTTKFLLQACQKMYNPNKIQPLPRISLSDIIITQPTNHNNYSFKYRHPLDSLYCCHHETLEKYMSTSEFNPGQISEMIEAHLISNVGICVMGMCLLEDCFANCFNFLGEMCTSVVEKKIQYIYELYSRKDQEKTAKQLCKMLQAFVFQFKNQKKLNFVQSKSIYNKISIKYHREILDTKLQTSIFKSLYDEPVIEKKCSSDKEQQTSASMEVKIQKIQICSKALLLKRGHGGCSYRIGQKYSIDSSLLTARNLSVDRRKDWKIEKSSERKIQINQTLKPITKQWAIQNEDIKIRPKNSIKVIEKYKQIDQKWSEDEELFKNMPPFQRFSSQVLGTHFSFIDLQPIEKVATESRVLLN